MKLSKYNTYKNQVYAKDFILIPFKSHHKKINKTKSNSPVPALENSNVC